MEYAEYRRCDAVGLAELVTRGEVSAVELLDTALSRLDAVDPTLNTVVQRLDERARVRAEGPLSGPFAGVPFLVKDLLQDVVGTPTGSGSRALAEIPAAQNSVLVDRWLDSGLVIFGKTNTPEFGAKGITEPEAGGVTRNPWNPELTPGGSSGGSAAAVAAGVVPVAGANDGGGSIRIPAACCGLLGLKPGRGVVPTGPVGGEPLHGAVSNGVISRTVRDSAAMLDVMAGTYSAAPYAVGGIAGSYAAVVSTPPRRLRIGYATASPIGTGVDPEAVAGVDRAVVLLDELGHRVEPAETGIDERRLAADFLTMWFASLALEVDDARRRTGCGPGGFEFDTRMLAELGRSVSAPDYLAAHARWADYIRDLAAFHERYDLLLTPTLAYPPARVGELATPMWMRALGSVLMTTRMGRLARWSGLIDKVIDDNLGRTPYTQLANITGRPAISVPLHWTAEGVPLGVQFVAPLGGEALLLSLAGELEQASPWFDRQPPFLPAPEVYPK
ncbi:amidase [Rhodococcus artemisiae]|uniref:amidase n=1 Tax=Rhodococcus artemisiae TaxID=714159 RepID=A0ABU7L7Z9_9NOCA|nr:amidase family protein [Rhodococcus artemisiae]MEE2057660.1 amidase family protein [Rhodococcus artemisiae]